ncbi:unnamed protein product [Oikopleura dioica]|uniref:Tyr recombinase domain-containing protein n=1 Tax=Oikopleura dioica TaxID=34765 RepID=E4XEJ6_OIKDI|nr:unnamed protein product [Oikopleura dioica]CBY40592.1 unnamed protein product [Oikopleura dioica]
MTFLNRKELEGLWKVAEQLTLENFEAANDEEKVDIFLDRLSRRPLQKAYTYQRGSSVILDVVETELGKPATAAIKRKVKNWATRRARESSKETLQYPKQAGLLEDEDVIILWKELLKSGKPKPKEAALALAICYISGARMGEALSIRIEDCQFKKDSGNEFFEAHLRSTKTNPFAQRKETLTLPLSVEHAVPAASEIKKLCHNKKSGLLFPALDGCTRTASDYLARYAKSANLEKPVSAHSGRVSYYVRGRRAGLSQAELTHTLRWAPTSRMPDYYERTHMETAPDGAPTKIAEARREKRQKNQAAKAEKKGSSSSTEPQEAAETRQEPRVRSSRKARLKAEESIKNWLESSDSEN